MPQIDSKIKQLQSELQHKVQTFDGKRLDARDEYGQQTAIKRLVKQFDPLNDPIDLSKAQRPATAVSAPNTASYPNKDAGRFNAALRRKSPSFSL